LFNSWALSCEVILDHSPVSAFLAAETAEEISFSFPESTSAIFASVPGSNIGIFSPEVDDTHSPSINN
jgi:hypothetical protein